MILGLLFRKCHNGGGDYAGKDTVNFRDPLGKKISDVGPSLHPFDYVRLPGFEVLCNTLNGMPQPVLPDVVMGSYRIEQTFRVDVHN